MVRRFVAHGDLVDIEEVELIRRVPMADMFNAITTKEPVAIGPLGVSAKFIYVDESNPRERHLLVMTEVNAGLKNMRYLNRRFNLSVPWTYFLYDFRTAEPIATARRPWGMGSVFVYWSPDQVNSWDGLLYRAFVPNCDHNGLICYGDTGVTVDLPLNVRTDRLTSEFYRTTFTHDSGTGVPWQTEGAVTWARWEQETAAHGAAAYRNFPEWTDRNRMPTRTVTEAFHRFTRNFGDGEEPQPIPMPNVPGGIPDLPRPMTFGRAEEWLQTNGITAVDRHRLLTALQNLHADEPAAIEAPVEPAINPNDINHAEGGMPLNDDEERVR